MGFLGFLKKEDSPDAKGDKTPEHLTFGQPGGHDEFDKVPVPPEPFKKEPFRTPPVPDAQSMEGSKDPFAPPTQPRAPPQAPDIELEQQAAPDPAMHTPSTPEGAQTDWASGATGSDEFALPDLPEADDSQLPISGAADQTGQATSPFGDDPARDVGVPDISDPKQSLDEAVSTAPQDEHAEFKPPVQQLTSFAEEVKSEQELGKTGFAEEQKEEKPEPEPTLEEASPLYSEPEKDVPKINYPKEHAAALPKEIFIANHEYFDTLDKIKHIRKLIRENDQVIRHWEDIDVKQEGKKNVLMEQIDQIQEQLIKIDTELFERGEH